MIRYYSTHIMPIKDRWYGKTLLDVFKTEYKTRSITYYTEAIMFGAIRVNNKKVAVDYKIKPSDLISHLLHIHEPSGFTVDIIEENEDLIVVNKPSGMACHPTGCYFYHSVTQKLNRSSSLSCINRLDVPTTGVLLIAKKNPDKYHKLLLNRNVEKVYVALVLGKFDDSIVNKNLKVITGGCVVVDDVLGKEAITEFKLLTFNGEYSLVECRPLTGRQHQIRVHLQYIGFPIINDKMYGAKDRIDLASLKKSNHTPLKTKPALYGGSSKSLFTNMVHTRDDTVSHTSGDPSELTFQLNHQNSPENLQIGTKKLKRVREPLSNENQSIEHIPNITTKNVNEGYEQPTPINHPQTTLVASQVHILIEDKVSQGHLPVQNLQRVHKPQFGQFVCDGSENVPKNETILSLKLKNKKRNLNMSNILTEIYLSYRNDEGAKAFAVRNCEGINNRVYFNLHDDICLHASKYTINGKTYTAPLPYWAQL